MKAKPKQVRNRIELIPNTYEVGATQALQLWRLLITPMLIGFIFFHYVLGWSQEQLLLAIALLFIALANIYFFYRRKFNTIHKRYLLIEEDVLYIFDREGICLKEDLNNIHSYQPKDKDQDFLAILIQIPSGGELLVGAKHPAMSARKSCDLLQDRPDYWLADDRQWQEIERSLKASL